MYMYYVLYNFYNPQIALLIIKSSITVSQKEQLQWHSHTTVQVYCLINTLMYLEGQLHIHAISNISQINNQKSLSYNYITITASMVSENLICSGTYRKLLHCWQAAVLSLAAPKNAKGSLECNLGIITVDESNVQLASYYNGEITPGQLVMFEIFYNAYRPGPPNLQPCSQAFLSHPENSGCNFCVAITRCASQLTACVTVTNFCSANTMRDFYLQVIVQIPKHALMQGFIQRYPVPCAVYNNRHHQIQLF